VYVNTVFVIARPRSCVRQYVDVSAARTTRTASSVRHWCTWRMLPRWECYSRWLQTPNCRRLLLIVRQTVLRPVSQADGTICLAVLSVMKHSTWRYDSDSNALPLPESQRWSPLASPFSQAFSKHCKNTDTCWYITQYACLLSQLLPGTHST